MPTPMDELVADVIHGVRQGTDAAVLVRLWAPRLEAMGACRVLAVGKAAHPMAEAAAQFIREKNLRDGLIVSPPLVRPRLQPAPNFRAMDADHPLPTARSVEAGAAAAELVRGLSHSELLLVLLSGGSSALLTLPTADLALEDIREATNAMLLAGATIDELNSVRRHCEQLKGGGLLRLATKTGCKRVLTLVLSDVVGDRLEAIGSGPTAPDPTTYSDALAVLDRYGLSTRLAAVSRHLRDGEVGRYPETLKAGDLQCEAVQHHILGGNQHAVECAASALSVRCMVVDQRTEVIGEAREIGAQLAARVRQVSEHYRNVRGRRALVWGGETTVTVRGEGKGGRNQELALAAAIALDGAKNCLVMSFATDGVDGNSTAAGAVVTGETLAVARAAGLDAAAFLADNDSTTFFRRLDEAAANEKGRRTLIQTGPTGTNVNDVMIALAWND